MLHSFDVCSLSRSFDVLDDVLIFVVRMRVYGQFRAASTVSEQGTTNSDSQAIAVSLVLLQVNVDARLPGRFLALLLDSSLN